MQHSRIGWALAAVHDAEDVAEGLGVATFRYKLLALVASAVIGGVGGSAVRAADRLRRRRQRLPPDRPAVRHRDERPRWTDPLVRPGGRRRARGAAPGPADRVRPGRVAADRPRRDPRRPGGRRARRHLRPSCAPARCVALVAAAVVVTAVGLAPARDRPAGRGAGRPAGRDRRGADGPAAPARSRATAPAAAGATDRATPPARRPAHGRADRPSRSRSAAPLVECRNVAKHFGGVRALDDVSLTIRRRRDRRTRRPERLRQDDAGQHPRRQPAPDQRHASDVAGQRRRRAAAAPHRPRRDRPHLPDPRAVHVDDRAGQRRHGRDVRPHADGPRPPRATEALPSAGDRSAWATSPTPTRPR